MKGNWKPIEKRNAVRRTRDYMYRGVETKLRNPEGHEAIIFTANRRFPIPRGKYMPHQGIEECARRIRQRKRIHGYQ